MNSEQRMEPRPIAKAQKSMVVPEDLYRLIADRERQTGTTFTRQAIAAFFAYFFTDVFRPDPVWMQAVIAVEQGEIPVGDVPRYVAQIAETLAETELRQLDDDAAIGCDSPRERKDAVAALVKARRQLHRWEKIRELSPDDPISALQRFWARPNSIDFKLFYGVDVPEGYEDSSKDGDTPSKE